MKFSNIANYFIPPNNAQKPCHMAGLLRDKPPSGTGTVDTRRELRKFYRHTAGNSVIISLGRSRQAVERRQSKI
jgi:hypothetical protein